MSGGQAARKKARDATQDLQALQALGQGGGGGAPAGTPPAVAALEKAVATRQQKLDGLQARINDIEDRIFAPLSAKVGAPCLAAFWQS